MYTGLPYDELPPTLPIFPLTGALLLPQAQLPLNIFEPRYLEMVDDALREHRLIGMIQPKEYKGLDLYDVGCAGRIVAFEETDDGRYLITLLGLSRFKVTEELSVNTKYRRVQPEWSEFKTDLEQKTAHACQLNEAFFKLLELYFTRHDLSVDWEILQETPPEKLISALCMICPFDPCEKQALLESDCCEKRSDVLMAMMQMAIHDKNSDKSII